MSDTFSLENFFAEGMNALKKAAVEPSHPFRIPVLGTVAQGVPSLRSVILRDFLEEPFSLVFFTHAASPKVYDMLQNPVIACCAYDAGAGLQLRMNGTSKVHRQDSVARKYWATVPEARYADYDHDTPPGKPLPTVPDGGLGKALDRFFTVIVMEINEIDMLLIRRDGHQRAIFSKAAAGFDGMWVQP